MSRAYARECILARQRQRRAVRLAILSLMLTALLFVATGCTPMLFGSSKKAYDILLKARSDFKYPSSVQIVSGEMDGGYLYCIIRAKNGFGNYRSDSYRISEGGYITESSRSMCYTTGKLNTEAINRALGSAGASSSRRNGGSEGMELLIIIFYIALIILAIYIDWIIAGWVAAAAQDKGYDENTWHWRCFWFFPVVPIIVAALPDKKLQKIAGTMVDLQEKMLKKLETGAVAGAQADPFSDLPEL